MMRNPRISLSPKRVAALTAIVGTILAVGLHILFGLSAGALWRDEVNSLEVATMRTFGEMWANLSFDSFPALFFLILRFFAGVPASASDAALRGFGVAIGLLILGAVWLNARWLRLGFPLITLALIGFNPMVIRYGDSIRSYGLGILLALLTISAIWRLLESFTLRRLALATIVAILSVQSLYYNAILLFAICLGAVVVTLVRRDFKQALIVLGIGALTAASLLPYVPTMQRVQACSFMWKRPTTFLDLWKNGSETLGSSIPYGLFVWSTLLAVVFGIGVWVLYRGRTSIPRVVQERLIFALVTLLLGTICYAGFLRMLSYIVQPWYYVAFAAFAATCLEMICSALGGKERNLIARSACALLIIGAALFPALRSLEARQTNMDAIANTLESVVQPDDFIIINSWNYGISFCRYYHGVANYTTVPPVADLRSHRVDLAKRQMMSLAPLAPVLQRIEEVLRAGNTVWLVGSLHFLPPGKQPLTLPPGRDGSKDFVSAEYYQAWSEQTGFFVQQNTEHFDRVQLGVGQPVIHYENLPLTAIRGWREQPSVSVR